MSALLSGQGFPKGTQNPGGARCGLRNPGEGGGFLGGEHFYKAPRAPERLADKAQPCLGLPLPIFSALLGFLVPFPGQGVRNPKTSRWCCDR